MAFESERGGRQLRRFALRKQIVSMNVEYINLIILRRLIFTLGLLEIEKSISKSMSISLVRVYTLLNKL